MDLLQKNSRPETDEQLVKLSLKDQEYFGYLVERYQDKLARYVNRITATSKEEIEDILQEVFIKVYENLNDFDTSLKFSSWIYRITHNQVISQYRKKQARPQKISLDCDLDYFKNLASEVDIAQELSQEERAEEVEKLLNKLDFQYKEILILKYFERKSYTEISDILKKPVNTVGTLLYRARKQFKDIANKEKNYEKREN
jgi:RNA polymerase sigma-70 factor, ECF subfamily